MEPLDATYQDKSTRRKERANVIVDRIRAAFDEKSQRNTRPRRIIAERLVELAASGADFTADDLWQELRLVEPKLGRATLYRSLEMLVNAGLLDRVDFADGTHHYRVCGGSHHHHFTRTQCHCVVEAPVFLPPHQFPAIGDQTNFYIQVHFISPFVPLNPSPPPAEPST